MSSARLRTCPDPFLRNDSTMCRAYFERAGSSRSPSSSSRASRTLAACCVFGVPAIHRKASRTACGRLFGGVIVREGWILRSFVLKVGGQGNRRGCVHHLADVGPRARSGRRALDPSHQGLGPSPVGDLEGRRHPFLQPVASAPAGRSALSHRRLPSRALMRAMQDRAPRHSS